MTRGREPEATGLSYDELPDRFGPVLLRPIKEHNPLEFKDLTRRQPKVLPVPEDVDEKKAQKLRNLAQYKGRSPEGNRRSVANLRRREKVADDKAVVLAEDAPVPSVPTPKQMPARPPEKGPTARHLRLVLSKQEYDLYVDTWNGIWQAHKDEYNLPEDLHDVHTICMETVLQMRMLSYAQSRPRQYSEKAYHNSTVRLQKARENLLARRKDRVEPAAKKGN